MLFLCNKTQIKLSSDAKRLIGRRFEDDTVKSDMKHWPFKVVNEGGKPKISVDYKGDKKTFFPEEISSMVLTKMKETAEAYIGKVTFSLTFLWSERLLSLCKSILLFLN